MAKRRQTTGLPKTRTPHQQEENAKEESSLREYKSRAEREAEIQRYVIYGTGAALALIVIIVGISLIVDQVINPGRTILEVNGETVNVREYENRVRFERLLNIEKLSSGINDIMENFDLSFEDAANQAISIDPYRTYWDELNIPDQMGLRVLNDITGDILVRQEATERGLTVTQEEIDAEIEEIFSFDSEEVALLQAEETPEPTPDPTATPTPFVSPTPSPSPAPTNTPEQEPTPTFTPFPTVPPAPTRSAEERISIFDETREDFFSLARQEAGYSREDVLEYFETQALRKKLAEEVTDATDTVIWVNTRHILVETEEEALDIIDALNAGESFAALAQAKGTDGTASTGGELGWAPLDNYVTEFADAIRDAPTGEIIGPVQTQFGFHAVQIREREDREAEEGQIEINLETAFTEWLDELRQSEDTQVETSDIWPDHVPDRPLWQFRPRA